MEGGFSGRVGGWRRRDRGSRQSPTKDGPLGKRRPRCARRQSLSWRDSVTVAKWRRPTPRSINNSPLSSSVPAGSSIVKPSSWPAAAQTRTARSISWFQTGHCSGRHCHDTGSFGEPQHRGERLEVRGPRPPRHNLRRLGPQALRLSGPGRCWRRACRASVWRVRSWACGYVGSESISAKFFE
jgi:hypothetical protein